MKNTKCYEYDGELYSDPFLEPIEDDEFYYWDPVRQRILIGRRGLKVAQSAQPTPSESGAANNHTSVVELDSVAGANAQPCVAASADITFDEVVCDICNCELVQPEDEPDRKVVFVFDGYALCQKCREQIEGDESPLHSRLNVDIIVEALEDYRRWFDGDDESDIEKRRAIGFAIQQVKLADDKAAMGLKA